MGADSEQGKKARRLAKQIKVRFEGNGLQTHLGILVDQAAEVIEVGLNEAFQAGVESVLDLIFKHTDRIRTDSGEGFLDRDEVEASLESRKR